MPSKTRQRYIGEIRRARRQVLAGKILFTGAFLFVAGSFAATIIAIREY